MNYEINTNETVEDIVAEIRAFAESQERMHCYDCRNIATDALRAYADRVEAAVKREMDVLIYSFDPTKADRSRAPDPSAYALEAMEPPCVATTGNAFELREAIRTLRQRFDNNVMAYQDRYLKFSGWHWHKKAAEAARWRDVFYELREACDAALSAPARNCDIYVDEDDAFAAWHDALNDGDVVSVRNAFAWLFAKAEKEGGSK